MDQRAEGVHLIGGDVDVERSVVARIAPEARCSKIEMKVRSMRLTLEATVINGEATPTPGYLTVCESVCSHRGTASRRRADGGIDQWM